MFGEVALLVFFFLYYMLWLTDESSLFNIYPARNWARYFSILHNYSGFEKVIDLICYNDAVNLAFFMHTYMLIYMFKYIVKAICIY